MKMTETTLNFIIWTNYGTNRGIQKVARAEKVKQKEMKAQCVCITFTSIIPQAPLCV